MGLGRSSVGGPIKFDTALLGSGACARGSAEGGGGGVDADALGRKAVLEQLLSDDADALFSEPEVKGEIARRIGVSEQEDRALLFLDAFRPRFEAALIFCGKGGFAEWKKQAQERAFLDLNAA